MSDESTILIIDDEKDLLDMLKYQLSAKGFNVVTAQNGVEGLEKLNTITPDLIILDINMPKMGGIEFYNEICEAEKPRFPIFVLTARANLEKLFNDFEVDGFMSKPFDVEELIKEINRILKDKKKVSIEQLARKKTKTHQVLVADNNGESLNKIALALLDEGYRVNTAKNGISAIELIMGNLPEIVLLRWEMADIAGDTIAMKLKKMSRTTNIRSIIYTDKTTDSNPILDELRKRSGIEQIVESSRPSELVDAVNQCVKSF